MAAAEALGDDFITFTSSEDEDDDAYLAALEVEAFQEQETHHARASNGVFSDPKAIQERIRQKNVESQILEYQAKLDQLKSTISQLEWQQEQTQSEIRRFEASLARLNQTLSDQNASPADSAAKIKHTQLQQERDSLERSLNDAVRPLRELSLEMLVSFCEHCSLWSKTKHTQS